MPDAPATPQRVPRAAEGAPYYYPLNRLTLAGTASYSGSVVAAPPERKPVCYRLRFWSFWGCAP